MAGDNSMLSGETEYTEVRNCKANGENVGDTKHIINYTFNLLGILVCI